MKQIKDDNLVGSHIAAEKEAEMWRRKAEAETKCKHSIIKDIQHGRKQCGYYAQQIADNVSIIFQ